MTSWPAGVAAITLFVDDLDEAKQFYLRAFELPVHFEDPESVVFALGGTLVNLLASSAAPELVAPAKVGGRDCGSRMQLTINVDDVDAALAGFATGTNTRGVRPVVLAKWVTARERVVQAFFASGCSCRGGARLLGMNSGTFWRMLQRAFAGWELQFRAIAELEEKRRRRRWLKTTRQRLRRARRREALAAAAAMSPSATCSNSGELE